jgi:hypothetical protein
VIVGVNDDNHSSVVVMAHNSTMTLFAPVLEGASGPPSLTHEAVSPAGTEILETSGSVVPARLSITVAMNRVFPAGTFADRAVASVVPVVLL